MFIDSSCASETNLFSKHHVLDRYNTNVGKYTVVLSYPLMLLKLFSS